MRCTNRTPNFRSVNIRAERGNVQAWHEGESRGFSLQNNSKLIDRHTIYHSKVKTVQGSGVLKKIKFHDLLILRRSVQRRLLLRPEFPRLCAESLALGIPSRSSASADDRDSHHRASTLTHPKWVSRIPTALVAEDSTFTPLPRLYLVPFS